MKTIRIGLLVLIIIGLGFLVTEKLWVPKLVNRILAYEGVEVPTTQASTTVQTSTSINSSSSAAIQTNPTGITFTASPISGNSPLPVTFTATIDSTIYGLGPFVINFGAGAVNHAAVGLTGKVGSNIYTTEPQTYTYMSPGTYQAIISKGGCVPGLSLGGQSTSSNQGSCDLGQTIDTLTVTIK